MKKKVYISGPMTGIENYNYPLFHAVEEYLKQLGHMVINPARHPIGLEWSHYMGYARLDVKACDVVIMLPGYEASKGAVEEFKLATELGKQVFVASETFMIGATELAK